MTWLNLQKAWTGTWNFADTIQVLTVLLFCCWRCFMIWLLPHMCLCFLSGLFGILHSQIAFPTFPLSQLLYFQVKLFLQSPPNVCTTSPCRFLWSSQLEVSSSVIHYSFYLYLENGSYQERVIYDKGTKKKCSWEGLKKSALCMSDSWALELLSQLWNHILNFVLTGATSHLHSSPWKASFTNPSLSFT